MNRFDLTILIKQALQEMKITNDKKISEIIETPETKTNTIPLWIRNNKGEWVGYMIVIFGGE